MELRKDYILDRWVIIASNRGKRPDQFVQKEVEHKSEVDFFAPGNEHLTPPEIERISNHDTWQMRVFPNKFHAVEAKGDPVIKTDNDFFTYADAFGYHEVLVETPDNRQLWDLSQGELFTLFRLYQKRIEQLAAKKGIAYVQVFKNHGIQAGTSLLHSHSQLIAYNHIPATVQSKINVTQEWGVNVYERILSIEKSSFRRCFENTHAVAFAPYASRVPFELWVFPKFHKAQLSDLSDAELGDFVTLLQQSLLRLKTLQASFNYVLYYAPHGSNLHLHLEILPRLSTWAGFEMAGDYINIMPPEQAAAFYRGETHD